MFRNIVNTIKQCLAGGDEPYDKQLRIVRLESGRFRVEQYQEYLQRWTMPNMLAPTSYTYDTYDEAETWLKKCYAHEHPKKDPIVEVVATTK